MKREWVIFAIQHNVQRLVLYGIIDNAPKFLYSVFSCKSLVKLELGVKNLRLTLSETSTLPNRRKLKLKYSVLSDLTLRRDPFSSFPSLEKLSIFFCDIINLKILSVFASKLKEFIMCSCPGMEYCSFSFKTPTLSKFIFINNDATAVDLTIPEHSFGLVLNAGDAYVKSESTYDRSCSILKVTRELFKTYKLMLNHWLIEYLSMVLDLPRQMAVDVFKNLIYLEITIWPVVEHVRTVLLLVSRCPYLAQLYLAIAESEIETRELPGVDDDFIDFDDEGRGFRSLSYIKIDNFGGDNTEMMLVRLLLAYARELDLMRIVMNMFMVKNDMDKKIPKILRYEKASAFADIIFD